MTAGTEVDGEASALVAALLGAGATLATAESLTGGGLAAAVTSVPGASAVFRGGVVAYATDLKAELLGVDLDLLQRVGPVDPDVATAMARGVRDRLRATYGVATTGVAGPDQQDGHPVGEVYLAVVGPVRSLVRAFSFAGDREAVRAATVSAALSEVARELPL